mgnify:CR=1 FL=1
MKMFRTTPSGISVWNRPVLRICVAFATVAVLAAGSGAPGTLAARGLFHHSGKTTQAKHYTIAVIPKGLDNPVFFYAHYGADKRAQELGNVTVDWTASSTSDVTQEVQVINGLIARHVDAMAVDANAPGPLIGPVNKAVKAGIKVIAWDSDVVGSNEAAFYGISSFAMGVKLAQETIHFMGTKGTVILVSGGPGATNLNQRLAGAKSALKKYPGIHLLGPFFHNDDLPTAQKLTNSLLTAHPTAGAILMVAGVPFFGAMSALPKVIQNHGKVKIITTDTLAAELPFVKDGYVQALVGQDYWGWGYQSVQILYNMLAKHCTYPHFVFQAMPVVTKANVGQWISKWKQASTAAGAARVFKESPVACGAHSS